MDLDFLTLNHLIYLIGELTVIIILGSLVTAFVLVIISLYSIKKKRLYFPELVKSGLVSLEGLMKGMFRFFGLEDREIYSFSIKLFNSMNSAEFARVPVAERAIFFPQCLRSSRCPAHLTPDGLKCVNCGQCDVGKGRLYLEKMGYKVFIIPGSSFIKRMAKKYRPKAIIGVGCLSEVKEGLEMADKMGLVVMGVVTLKEGCVETIANWPEIYEIAILGIDPASVPEDLHTLTD
jgi:uncharacterized protein